MSKILDIVGYRYEKINLFPKSLIEEITQNIVMIITTITGSLPLDREFGISAEFIDAPSPYAMMKLRVFITECIQEYEPRVSVKEIAFVSDPSGAMDGRLYPKIKVEIKDEYL